MLGHNGPPETLGTVQCPGARIRRLRVMTSAQPRVSRRGLLAGSAATIALAGLGSGTPASGVIPAVVDAALPTARDLARAVR